MTTPPGKSGGGTVAERPAAAVRKPYAALVDAEATWRRAAASGWAMYVAAARNACQGQPLDKLTKNTTDGHRHQLFLRAQSHDLNIQIHSRLAMAEVERAISSEM